MNNKKKIILGIIGCGEIGQFHIENIISYLPEIKLKSICDLDTQKINGIIGM